VSDKLKPCDRVDWITSHGETHGAVVRKLASPTRIKAHVAKPGPEHPQYLVESEKTGARAAHKPNELRKRQRCAI
jgi:hypothetical protein